jgi:hypothetical protein
VLHRHESLAAGLGAKLMGPLLLKSFEKLFEGPIKVLEAPSPQDGASITWLDVVEFAKSNPNGLALSDSRNEARVCQFWVKQCKVEISEDDYRLILSKGPERMIPTQALPEDELAELGTIDILEQRLTLLIKKADLVAGRARQLNYLLKGRRTTIQNRRAGLQQTESVANPSHGTDPRQPTNLFHSVNNSPMQTSNGDSRSIHQDLLRQFLTDDQKSTSPRAKPTKPNSVSPDVASLSGTPTAHSHGKTMMGQHAILDDGTGGQYRPLMTARVEKMIRGDGIWPPCDRCRRLRMDCTKHLTACSGCTKKHAKCTWKDMTQEEMLYITQMDASMAENGTLQVEIPTNANLDPGLSGSSGASLEIGSGNDDGTIFVVDHSKARKTGGTPADHSVLGQKAPPATVAGN